MCGHLARHLVGAHRPCAVAILDRHLLVVDTANAGAGMNFPDWTYRLIYRYGFRAARLVWRFTKPHHTGALVMLWQEEKVLLVRTSYQDVWMAPGGGIEREETPAQAALREV